MIAELKALWLVEIRKRFIDIDSLLTRIFVVDHSLRLTKFGDEIFRKCFIGVKFEYDAKLMLAKHYIILDQFKGPYYIGTKKITIYDPYDIFLIKIKGGMFEFLEIEWDTKGKK